MITSNTTFAPLLMFNQPSIWSNPSVVGEVGSNGMSETIIFSDASSATNDVVTLSKGRLNILDTKLKIEIDTPTAPSSTGPEDYTHIKGFNNELQRTLILQNQKF
jgi:hypothetical protein